ncbi:MAG: hypothetical protein WCH33_09520, partial [Betaproteobacteria bacterium]
VKTLHELLKPAGKLHESSSTERTNGSQGLAIIADYPRHHDPVAGVAIDSGMLAGMEGFYRGTLQRPG